MEKKKKVDSEWVGGHKVYGESEIKKEKNDDWLTSSAEEMEEKYGLGNRANRRIDGDECKDKE